MSDYEKGDTYNCPECGRSITVGSDGIEYGHSAGISDHNKPKRCPRRPGCVDPSDIFNTYSE